MAKKIGHTWLDILTNRRLCIECNEEALADSLYCRRHDPRYIGISRQTNKIPGRSVR